jgi:AmiR/NasT family two-component response regulator
MAIGYAREVHNLNEAVKTRTLIGQATGVVMERYGLPDHRAFALLTRLSQERYVKLRQIAQEIVDALASDGGDGVNHVIRGEQPDS